ncbi:DUF1735 domain-containing protein [Mariniphaga sediminis]|uniref:DUF1735 domain-containing protein n=1 Tax=Mariniphaga sediminis TaxID=1628158 RepID=A0A399CYY8_9BACT|nr:DUF1735 domain-containing protein [Mariniphaga sediminis]RIH64426.1 DUF1735 domain-containing protein [Mariniphaga sediminis]
MKNIKQIIKGIIPLFIMAGVISCEVLEMELPQFAKSVAYFGNQSPLRTLILGNTNDFDNTNDNNLNVSVTVWLGGVSENTEDRKVEYTIDESLVQNLYSSDGAELVVMPESYYNIENLGSVIIPAGSMQSEIVIQLTESFLDDAEAFKDKYVIPFRITNAETDSILMGEAKVDNPDIRVKDDWSVAPQNYALYMIKYINEYHGNYYYSGSATIIDADGNETMVVDYGNADVTSNTEMAVDMISKNAVSFTTPVQIINSSPDTLYLDLAIDSDGSVTLQKSEGADIEITGTGKYIEGGNQREGKQYNMITLDYNYEYDFYLEPVITKYNNTEASYTGTWNHNNESGNYNNDRSYCKTKGDFLELEFFGNKISVFVKAGPNYGSFDVYIDDELIAEDVSCSFTSGYQTKAFELIDLENTYHTLKCVIHTDGKWCIFDYFETQADGVIPNGKYTWNVKDTLIVKDRGVSPVNTFTPVVN